MDCLLELVINQIQNYSKDYLDMDEIGYLIVKPGSTYTNIEGVFAAGDVS